eukprot:TRINITY_DN3831_c0_g1_i1.p1 TRINITY_DN3831_c0_g1~~TRINITY_DN3831_c0_g1_i1.p1  ORF type:complete len:829 (-),score=180.17 TRINITY_DN3831_c0_g1_i1:46-2478(-)
MSQKALGVIKQLYDTCGLLSVSGKSDIGLVFFNRTAQSQDLAINGDVIFDLIPSASTPGKYEIANLQSLPSSTASAASQPSNTTAVSAQKAIEKTKRLLTNLLTETGGSMALVKLGQVFRSRTGKHFKDAVHMGLIEFAQKHDFIVDSSSLVMSLPGRFDAAPVQAPVERKPESIVISSTLRAVASDISQFTNSESHPELKARMQVLTKQFRQLEFDDPHLGVIVTYAWHVVELCAQLLYRVYVLHNKQSTAVSLPFGDVLQRIALLMQQDTSQKGAMDVVHQFRSLEQQKIAIDTEWTSTEVELVLISLKRIVEFTSRRLLTAASSSPVTATTAVFEPRVLGADSKSDYVNILREILENETPADTPTIGESFKRKTGMLFREATGKQMSQVLRKLGFAVNSDGTVTRIAEPQRPVAVATSAPAADIVSPKRKKEPKEAKPTAASAAVSTATESTGEDRPVSTERWHGRIIRLLPGRIGFIKSEKCDVFFAHTQCDFPVAPTTIDVWVDFNVRLSGRRAGQMEAVNITMSPNQSDQASFAKPAPAASAENGSGKKTKKERAAEAAAATAAAIASDPAVSKRLRKRQAAEAKAAAKDAAAVANVTQSASLPQPLRINSRGVIEKFTAQQGQIATIDGRLSYFRDSGCAFPIPADRQSLIGRQVQFDEYPGQHQWTTDAQHVKLLPAVTPVGPVLQPLDFVMPTIVSAKSISPVASSASGLVSVPTVSVAPPATVSTVSAAEQQQKIVAAAELYKAFITGSSHPIPHHPGANDGEDMSFDESFLSSLLDAADPSEVVPTPPRSSMLELMNRH